VRAPDTAVLTRLEGDGIITLDGTSARTTRRWQGAMMRAIARRISTEKEEVDVRYVIADALLEVYGLDAPTELIAAAVDALTQIELKQLLPAQQRVSHP
jgi:hypothetical protein